MLTCQSEGISVFQSELYQTNCFVIETNDLVLIVDPNYLPSELAIIRKHVDAVKGDRPLYLFFTHSDFDHIVGYGSFTDCRIIAGSAFANHPDKVERVSVVERLDDEFYISRPYRIEFPRVDHVIEQEGEQLTIGETVLTFRTAFGHNGDGLMCLVEPCGALITGDYVSDIEFPFVFDTFAAYRSTLEKIVTYGWSVPGLLLLPSHGSVTADQDEILHRAEVSEQYLSLCEEQLELGEGTSRFETFMDLQDYRFKIGFRKRHDANMVLLANEQSLLHNLK
ncbi:MBL fold metallo-hydrolase [Paenibacillus sp. CF384]|uniref:MBL fold metallo-hydrolase n=1 Tax=Paenibacillus sp. CF384 TaxID=1884382 RepID=UPI00089A5A0C|nr:MBL fold metallo-hydrolase [Paenibacillus sp. CF384]SDW57954.1 Glyoxylase, beta-lactamase superfamily II [Paenibacillus sp. CF384]